MSEDVSEWTAIAIQNAFYDQRRKVEDAKAMVRQKLKELDDAESVLHMCAQAVDDLQRDANRLGVTLS